MKNKEKILTFSLIIIAVSIIIGIIFDGKVIGTTMLIIGFLNAFYMSKGKWYSYCFGIIYSIMYAFVSYKEGLYGVVIITILFYEPMQILGLINWIKHKNDDSVITKVLSRKQKLIIFAFVIIASLSFGLLLTKIKTQNIAFLDSTSQVLNIMATILLMLRFSEAWYLWILGSIVDLTIWIICFVNKGDYTFMMLIIACVYIFMNFYGFFNWKKLEKENKKDSNLIA